jgi:hypothetical protein
VWFGCDDRIIRLRLEALMQMRRVVDGEACLLYCRRNLLLARGRRGCLETNRHHRQQKNNKNYMASSNRRKEARLDGGGQRLGLGLD